MSVTNINMDDMVLNAQIDTREEAIRVVGAVLVDRGYSTMDYIPAMFEREDKSSTFVGNGVAVPHGTEEAKDAVKKTGISLLQVPDGVDWDGIAVYLVFGVAACAGDEHLEVLSKIAAVCADPMNVEKIRYAATEQEILELFSAQVRGGE